LRLAEGLTYLEHVLVRERNPSVLSLQVDPRVWSRFDDAWADQNTYFDRRTHETIIEDWTLGLRIAFVNKNRNSNSKITSHLSPLHTDVPIGLHVYHVNGVLEFPPAIHTRFADFFARMGSNGIPHTGNIAFYTRGDNTNIFSKTLPMLVRAERHIAEVVEWYGESIKCILGASAEDLAESTMNIVYYAEDVGIKQHIDNITSMDMTVGPVASIAIGEGGKYMDLFPTITRNIELTPVRVITKFSDVIILDGDARLEYAHSVPLGHTSEMYSIVFKFRNIRKTADARVNAQLKEPIHYTIDPATGQIPAP